MVQPVTIEYSVVICTHNHAALLKSTLGSLRKLRHPDSGWELLLVNNASTDETEDILRMDDWKIAGVPVHIVNEPELGIAYARNRGIRESRGNYVLFIDDDETPHPDWLIEYEQAIRKWQPDAMGGRIEVMFEGAARPPWLQDELLGFLGQLSYGSEPRRLTEPGTPIFTGNAGFRKQIFDTLGVFDTSLGRRGGMNTGGEDVDIYRRMISAKLCVWWIPDTVIYHRIQSSKLKKSYFLDLHLRQGRMEGSRKNTGQSRLPPLYLVAQLGRALKTALTCWIRQGRRSCLRKEMNAAYFLGYIHGWLMR